MISYLQTDQFLVGPHNRFGTLAAVRVLPIRMYVVKVATCVETKKQASTSFRLYASLLVFCCCF